MYNYKSQGLKEKCTGSFFKNTIQHSPCIYIKGAPPPTPTRSRRIKTGRFFSRCLVGFQLCPVNACDDLIYLCIITHIYVNLRLEDVHK